MILAETIQQLQSMIQGDFYDLGLVLVALTLLIVSTLWYRR